MNTVSTAILSPAPGALHDNTSAEAQDSVFSFMMQYQRVLNKEARADHKLEQQAQQLQAQAQAHQTPGFLQSIAKFLTGSDAGSGNAETGSTLSEKAHQPQAEWNDWKFLHLR